MRDGYDELQKLGVDAYGVSFDTPAANKAWKEQHSFPFTLLSDEDRALAVAVGAAEDKSAGWAKRMSYLLDEEGKVLKAYPRVSPSTHLDVVLADLEP